MIKVEHGDTVEPDEWKSFECLGKQRRVIGSDFSLRSVNLEGVTYAVNVDVTGRKKHFVREGIYKVRCKIEFVRESEANVLSGGWLYKRGV